jgi:hypothetical protein
MKKIALAFGFLLALTCSSLAATCAVTSVQVKGNDGTIVQMAVADDGTGSGNCLAAVKDAAVLAAVQAPWTSGTNMGGFVGLQSNTTGGCTPGHLLTAASNNATQIGTAGTRTLCEISFFNTTTGVFDIRLYDTGTAPSAGAPCNSATGVVANYVVQSNAISPGFTINLGTFGKAFVNGLVVCITGANADNDNTNAAIGGNLNYSFK